MFETTQHKQLSVSAWGSLCSLLGARKHRLPWIIWLKTPCYRQRFEAIFTAMSSGHMDNSTLTVHIHVHVIHVMIVVCCCCFTLMSLATSDYHWVEFVFFSTVKLKNAYVNLKTVSSRSMEFQFWVNLTFTATKTSIFQHVWRLLRTPVAVHPCKTCEMGHFTIHGDVAAQFNHVQRFCFSRDPHQLLVPVTCPHTGITFIIWLTKACFLTFPFDFNLMLWIC